MLKVKDFQITATISKNAKVRKVKMHKHTSYGSEYIEKYYRVEGSAYALVVHSYCDQYYDKKEHFSHVSFEEIFSMGLFKTKKLAKIFELPTKVVCMLNSNKDLCRLLFVIGERVKHGTLEVPKLTLLTGSKKAKKEAILDFFTIAKRNGGFDEYQISAVTCWEFMQLLKSKRNFSAMAKYLVSLTDNTEDNIPAENNSAYIKKMAKA